MGSLLFHHFHGDFSCRHGGFSESAMVGIASNLFTTDALARGDGSIGRRVVAGASLHYLYPGSFRGRQSIARGGLPVISAPISWPIKALDRMTRSAVAF